MSSLLFAFLAAAVLTGALTVLISRQPLFAALGLLAVILGLAGLFLVHGAEFAAAVQVFVYGGGVLVLFVFVIMLVSDAETRQRRSTGGVPLAALVVGGGLVLLGAALMLQRLGPAADLLALRSIEGAVVGNTRTVAWSLFRESLLPFELLSLYLVVAMVAAIALAQREEGEP